MRDRCWWRHSGAVWSRSLALMVAISLLLVTSGNVQGEGEAPFQETRFWTGCDPGPYQTPAALQHLDVTLPPETPASQTYQLAVDLDSAGAHRPILGTGFNMENALWSCPPFHGILAPEILDPFKPAIARVDTGLLPAAPADVSAMRLTPDVYSSVLSSSPYAESWDFLRTLNQAGVRVVLGVWGGPAQFTDENDRLGTLSPAHYDDYVDYVASVVSYLVRDEGVRVWATTIANEPDGGDGNRIPPDGLAYIAHQLALRLEPLGVLLYGPDTSTSIAAMDYIPPLLDDPVVASDLAFVSFHQYYAGDEVEDIADYVRAREPALPVVVTEYTSFNFGDLDSGQQADDGVGFMLDVANTLLSHYRSTADAALYWDAVDYLQPGHNAITRWGLLRSPQDGFAPRHRYYGLLQILPYLQPGARLLDADWQGDASSVGYLAVETATGSPAIFFVNQSVEPVDVSVSLNGATADAVSTLNLWRSDVDHNAQLVGQLAMQNAAVTLTLPSRSITTLASTTPS